MHAAAAAAAAGTPALDPHLRIPRHARIVHDHLPGTGKLVIDIFIIMTWIGMMASIDPTQPTPDPPVTADGRGLSVPCQRRPGPGVYRYLPPCTEHRRYLGPGRRRVEAEGQKSPLRVLSSVDSASNWDEGAAIPRPPVERPSRANSSIIFSKLVGAGDAAARFVTQSLVAGWRVSGCC